MFIEAPEAMLPYVKIKYRDQGVGLRATPWKLDDHGTTMSWELDPDVRDHDLNNLKYELERMTAKYDRAFEDQQVEDAKKAKNKKDLEKAKALSKKEQNKIDSQVATLIKAKQKALNAKKKAEIFGIVMRRPSRACGSKDTPESESSEEEEDESESESEEPKRAMKAMKRTMASSFKRNVKRKIEKIAKGKKRGGGGK